MKVLYTKEQIDKIMKIRDQYSKMGENLNPDDGPDGLQAAKFISKQKKKQAQQINRTGLSNKR
jgi:hypothetical protein